MKLQFRKKGSPCHTTVTTVTTAVDGTLRTTVKPYKDGYWRWTYAGTATTAPTTSPADYVDVR